MEKERKFRFVGDPVEYDWDERPIKGKIYPGTYRGKNKDLDWESMPIQDFKENGGDDTWIDWEEVTEQENNRIPNQDQPASSITKFEMAVFMAMQGYISSGSNIRPNSIVELSIEIAQETFKQLEKCQE